MGIAVYVLMRVPGAGVTAYTLMLLQSALAETQVPGAGALYGPYPKGGYEPWDFTKRRCLRYPGEFYEYGIRNMKLRRDKMTPDA